MLAYYAHCLIEMRRASRSVIAAESTVKPMPNKLSTTGSLNRRSWLKKAAALPAITCAPAVISARASSGELNLLAWSDYFPAAFLDAFTAKTGIRVRHASVGSNEEIINKMRATQGRGIDLLSPTNTRSHQWRKLRLLQPLDVSMLRNTGNLMPNLLKLGEQAWQFDAESPHWLPLNWGTEAIAWRNDMWLPDGSAPSYGDLWHRELSGRVMIRPHSGMLAAGLYLERIAKLPPNAMREAYQSEAQMRAVWESVTRFCTERKSQMKLFWNDAESQKNALLNEGVMVAQTWDGPIWALRTQGEPLSYQAPVEGALTWVDGLSLSANASNVPQAYAFLDFCFEAQNAGLAVTQHGYNSAVRGAHVHADEDYQRNFKASYSAQALRNLWVWPGEPDWYAGLRTEYRNRFVNT